MHSNRRLLTVFVTAVLSLGTIAGCVRQRGDVTDNATRQQIGTLQAFSPNTAADGSGSEKGLAWKASKVSNSIVKRSPYVLVTGDVPIKNSKNSEAVTLTVESDVKFIKHFNVVNYDTEDPYLKGTAEIAQMLGETNKTYAIAYEITPNYLVLNKIVAENEISTTEKTYSRKEGGEWIVPIGGYDISFYNVQKYVNDDNRETNRIVTVPIAKENYLTAQYFKIDPYSFKKFGRQEKSDVLPRSIFEGEWYFSETNVETSLTDGGTVGNVGSYDISSDGNFTSATRIIFKVQGESLVGLNTNVDEEFKLNDVNQLNYNTVFKIEIKQVDYYREFNGADILTEKVDENKKPEDRSFIQLQYLTTETPQSVADQVGANSSSNGLLAKIFNQINNFKTILDVTYGVDYFSFTIRDAASKSIKRYAFRKINPAEQIQPRRAFLEDNYLLGTFTTKKSKKLDYKVNLKEDSEKLILMARHNPDKDIVYYFTDQTPKDDWHRNIGREAVNIWNQAFARIGSKQHVIINESKDVALGDIRYNALNIVKRAGAGLLGYGPSLIDSETGEIVSATMNMGMDNMMEQYYRIVRDYMGRKSGKYYDIKNDGGNTQLPPLLNILSKLNNNQVYFDTQSNTWALLGGPADGLNADGTQLVPNAFGNIEQEYMSAVGLPTNATVDRAMKIVAAKKTASYAYGNSDSFLAFGTPHNKPEAFSSTQIVDETIETNCKEVVALAERMKSGRISTAEEISIIEPCVKLFAQADSLTTVLHEMGHNLSMRHNFAGSTDQRNFPKLKSFQLKYMTIPDDMMQSKSSSVMDYLSVEGQQIDLGGYDLANLRWIYKGEVEDKDGNIVQIDPTMPITASLPADRMKGFTYCTDEQAGSSADPMCDLFDQGITPKETVRFRIESVYNSLSKLYRYDTRNAYQVAGSVFSNGTAMKEHYDKWRLFLRRHMGLSNGYLQKLTKEQYAKVIADIRKDPKEAETLNDHLVIRNMLVKFLVDVAFLSNKYCLVTDRDGEDKLIELEKIRSELLGFGDYSVVSSCQSPSVVNYFASATSTEGGPYTFKREFGYFLNGGNFDMDPSKIFNEVPDFVGSAQSRFFALFILTGRVSNSLVNRIEGYVPSMLDEPDIREYIQELLVDRLTNGVRLPSTDEDSVLDYAEPTVELFGKADIDKLHALPVFKNFSAEKDLSLAFALLLKAGLDMPSLPDDGRAVQMFVGSNPNREQVVNVFPDYVDYGSTYYYVIDPNSVTARMMSKYHELSDLKSEATVTPDSLIGVKAAIMKAIPSVLPQTDAVTFSDALKLLIFAQTTSQNLAKDPKNMPIVYLLQKSFAAEGAVIGALQQQMAANGLDFQEMFTALQDPKADPTAKANAEKFFAQSAAPVYGALAAKDTTIKVPTLANYETRLNSIMASHAQDFNSYAKQASELDAQSDSLLTLFQVIASRNGSTLSGLIQQFLSQ
jgi:hypothetical protein